VREIERENEKKKKRVKENWKMLRKRKIVGDDLKLIYVTLK